MRYPSIIILALLLAVPGPGWNWADEKPQPPPRQGKRDPKPGDGDDSGIARRSPTQVGDVDPAFWGALTEDQQNQAIAQLKTFADKAADQIKRPLRSLDSKYFLFYSDLPEMEAKKYLGLLGRMYGELADTFPIEKGRNVWRGKALVFVLSRIEDYRLYERLVESNDPAGSFGMTHCFGDGLVHMAFFRYPDELQFSHLLVHESVHGFLHRYRTPARIPSWINEGLADYLAGRLIANPRRRDLIAQLVRTGLAQHNNSLGDFFTARHIDGWQYPIAEDLTDWLIHRPGKGYLNFINGIKDGQSWEQSLETSMKLNKKVMISEYAKEMKLKPIKT